VFDLCETYAILSTDGATALVEAEAFWNDVMGGRHQGRPNDILVGIFDNKATWTTEEIHPAGDEPVLLLRGHVEMRLDGPDGVRSLDVHAGETCIVPRGTWHGAVVHEPGPTLHLTPGEGTLNRAPELLSAGATPLDLTPLDLDRTWIEITDGRAHLHDVDDVRARLQATDGDDGRTILHDEYVWQWVASTAPQHEDWPDWELHPSADEVVFVISGALDLVLDSGDGDRTVPLAAGDAELVPKGCWHRGLVREPGRLLTVTYGAPPHLRTA
jgi:mannose-6-phosphate isomerase-like protein (cupin superfamily)